MAAIIAAKRAEISEKLARFQNSSGSSPSTPPGPAVTQRPATVPPRTPVYQETNNRWKPPVRTGSTTPMPPPPSIGFNKGSDGGGLNLLEMQRKIAEAKAGIASGASILVS